MSVEDAKKIKNNRMVGSSIDLLYGDNYKGYRIVGTEQKFLDLYKAKIKEAYYGNTSRNKSETERSRS